MEQLESVEDPVIDRWDALLPSSRPYSVVRFDETVSPDEVGYATKVREVLAPCDAPDEWHRDDQEIVVYDEDGRIVKRTGRVRPPSILA
ncbi:hypothetical protein ACH9L7_16085 [Haloferax sp. S1W]|uniref:hypothetical protein n=1 Tax=Haloferax sp. S1W TaxID=3377110 RepID=UPI0037C7CDFA